ncbi:hypothetical protein FANTH_13700 [Fusarium anthophilum]|uniref:Uncharacterized protein n=1 Tax=Fusarium anthophilum TaxID=48485 RepID=A0A8H4YME6_9HYPO|nr:hypothetical protein FANTH_13700 [Fusarium anthophilum]
MNIDPFRQRAAKVIKGKREEKPGKKPGPYKSAYQRTVNATLLLKPTTAELTAFNQIKTALTQHRILEFFSPDRTLFVDFDPTGQGFGVMAYHV